MFFGAARRASLLATQTAVLWLINLGASAVVAWCHVPVPGTVLGLILLFALLCSGIARASWFEPAATLLVKHFALFFIPITVGLMSMGPLFALHGVGILVVLAASAAVGMAVCGLTYRCLTSVRSVGETQPREETDA